MVERSGSDHLLEPDMLAKMLPSGGLVVKSVSEVGRGRELERARRKAKRTSRMGSDGVEVNH